MHPRSLFSLAGLLGWLSINFGPLKVSAQIVEFERLGQLLTKGLGYSDGAKADRPPFDQVTMFKVLVVQVRRIHPVRKAV